jgi:hypothetical protein
MLIQKNEEIKRHSTETVQVLFYQHDQDFDLLDYQAERDSYSHLMYKNIKSIIKILNFLKFGYDNIMTKIT